ncbi:uncharacterized protein PADG_11632 [Paracoccidioides brasiliensis Pb18]|uniref:Uncharacterized protein n=1 Tax=Paracoccidioides brasiliensis (strain Pb18) TaxID=502780 RepID=A0A0A0HTY9_PARBD|nr:uncharacterized protein PADG_11632 [Paracoccidioides brasiliensis Pb18]KGM92102.1 hypothetical protein PADG_11632 [Paracoccidioides brasiliensis Pb18]
MADEEEVRNRPQQTRANASPCQPLPASQGSLAQGSGSGLSGFWLRKVCSGASERFRQPFFPALSPAGANRGSQPARAWKQTHQWQQPKVQRSCHGVQAHLSRRVVGKIPVQLPSGPYRKLQFGRPITGATLMGPGLTQFNTVWAYNADHVPNGHFLRLLRPPAYRNQPKSTSDNYLLLGRNNATRSNDLSKTNGPAMP